MKALVRFSLKQVVFFNLVFAVLIAVGAWALLALPVERYPEVNFGKVVITTIYPGASPQDMEALVTDKIEDALEDLEDVEFIRSKSYAQRSSLMVKFVDDSDYDALYDELRFKVLNIADQLPQGADPPVFNMLQVSDWLPVVSVNIAGPRSNRALTLMAEEMKIPLRRIPGVKEIKLQGEYEREFHVLLDPARMSALGVTFDQVAEALEGANVSIPAGDFTNGSGEFLVRVDERFRTRAEVMAVVVRSDADGSFVTVADVADDALLSHRQPSVISSVNGRDCVTLQVLKAPEGNALDIADEVRAVVDRFAPVLEREGVSIALTQDSTSYIEESIRTLGSNMLLGMVLVAGIIWYFMGLRNAGLTTVGIPFSFLVTMIFMRLGEPDLSKVVIVEIADKSPAAVAQLEPGDMILAVNDEEIDSMENLRDLIYQHLDEEVQLTFLRDNQEQHTTMVPRANPPEGEGAIGIIMDNPRNPIGLGSAVSLSTTAVSEFFRMIVNVPRDMISGAISPEESRLLGYKGMYDVFTNFREQDASLPEYVPSGINTLNFLGTITLSLALLNMLPLPALDGGRILLTLPELLFKKRVPISWEYAINFVGFSLMIILLIYINIQDFVNPVEIP